MYSVREALCVEREREPNTVILQMSKLGWQKIESGGSIFLVYKAKNIFSAIIPIRFRMGKHLLFAPPHRPIIIDLHCI